MVSRILQPCRSFAVSFIDDILIHSKTLKEHIYHVGCVLRLLEENRLRTKPSKCEFFVQRTSFLGHIVTPEGITPDPAKISTITEWPPPKDEHDLRSFLGLASYYRRFIDGFARLALPLFPLLSSTSKWKWTEACQASFDSLKRALTTAPVLQPFNSNAKYTVIDSDSSAFAIAATLLQGEDETRLHPVAYYSRKMSKAERNYMTREQELLAIKEALRSWKHYTYRTAVKVRTDHDSLRWIFTQPNLTGRLARWLEFLADYQVTEITHIPGKLNVVADALSRRPDYAQAAALSMVIPSLSSVAVVNSSLQTDLLAAQQVDPFCSQLRANLEGGALAPNDPIRDRYHMVNGFVMWLNNGRYRFVVPPPLRRLLLAEAHDSKLGGHFGVDKTYGTLAEAFYWPRMYQDVLRYVTTCNTCQLNKPYNRAPAGQLRPIGIPELPFLEVGLDLTGPLPASKQGNNFILTVTDYASRMARFIPCKSSPEHPISAEQTARLYFEHVFRFHGLPAVLRTDRGPQFTGQFFTELFRLCGTQQAFGTAYHPQSQGLTERANHTVIEALRHYLRGVFEDWEDHLAAVEFAYNHSVQPSLGVSPFEFLYGFNPRNPLTLAVQTAIPQVSEFMNKLQAKIEGARDAIAAAQLRQAEEAADHRTDASYKVGDYALLSTKDLSLAYPTKFTPKYLGPFKVLEVRPTGNAVVLELPPTMSRLDPTFSTHRLRPYKARDPSIGPPDPVPPPPAFTQDGQAFFEIERIVAERPCKYRRQSTVKYLVRWKGYAPEHDTWCEHPWFIGEPGGQQAVDAWRARSASIPVAPDTDRAARHRLRPRH
jgi:hypothetical protein